jgi:manganese transport system substrate-binding protein
MYWKFLLLLFMAFSAVIAAAQPEEDELPQLCPSGTDAPAQDAPKVLTTFTVLADMARNVACDRAVVESLTRVGAEIHGYEPSPGDLVRAQNADLVLYNGLNLEVWFEQFMEAVRDVPRVELSEGIEPLLIAEGAYKDLPNPHAWMSPLRAVQYVENIRDALIATDPENEDAYTENAAAYIAHLEAIDKVLRDSLAQLPEEQRVLVTCEGAFTYLTTDYGLDELYMWAINSDQQGTPRQVARLTDSVRARNVPAVFCETTVNNNSMMVVAQSTGAAFGGALYVDSLSEPDGVVPTYLDLLRYDVQLIVDGLLGR